MADVEAEAGTLFDAPMSVSAPFVDIAADEPAGKMTAADVKAKLRGRHPGDTFGSMVGQWTCIEEWRNIDLLALNAWRGADVIGYEVKVSRSDMRSELLRPDKRATAVAMTTEFYFAVPAGLLTPEEVAWEEPEWESADFARVGCVGVSEFGGPPYPNAGHQRWGGRCSWERAARAHVVCAPVPEVIKVPDWVSLHEGETEEGRAARWAQNVGYNDARDGVQCWACAGKGYLELSRVEREAPRLWVPRDVGLVTVNANGCRVVKPSPRRKKPEPIAVSRKHVNDLVRWVSHRPDPRHR